LKGSSDLFNRPFGADYSVDNTQCGFKESAQNADDNLRHRDKGKQKRQKRQKRQKLSLFCPLCLFCFLLAIHMNSDFEKCALTSEKNAKKEARVYGNIEG
jgi:hypothetical protein